MKTPDYFSPDGTVQLYHGDCLELLPQMPDGSVDAVITDPPYGHRNNDDDLISRREAALGQCVYAPGEQPKRPIANDGPEADAVFMASLPEWARLLRPGGVVACCCSGGGPDPHFARWALWLAAALEFKQMVIWDKGPMGMGWHYRRSYETVLVAHKPGAPCAWYDATNKIENVIRPGAHGVAKILPEADQHPTAKPEALAALFVRLHTKPGDVVVDPFMGGGAFGAAAVKHGRRFIGIESNPEFFVMARARLSAAIESQALFANLTPPETPTNDPELFQPAGTP